MKSIKKIFTPFRFVAIALLGGATYALAQTLPSFTTKTATGSTLAAIIFPQSATSQIRLVSEIASSDLSSSVLSVYSGTTAHYITVTNAAAQTSLTVESTNGIVANSLLYIQGISSNVVVTVSSVNNPSNITTTAAIGCAQPLNGEVEVLSSPMLLGVGASSYKTYASDALFVGNYGRCLYVTLNGTSSCTNYASVHYDATSQ